MPIIEKEFDAVKYMRMQRDQLSDKLSKMRKEEIVKYFNQKKATNKVKTYLKEVTRF